MVGAVLRAFADGRLFGEAYGSGTPWALALHGWRRTHADFAGVLGARTGAAALDALAVDLPGFGAAPEPPEAWGSEQYASAVSPLLDEMADQVVVLGHSFGGRVGVHLAALRPDRVSALVLTGVPFYRPAGARPRPKARYRLVRALARKGLVPEDRLEAARRRHGSEDYRAGERRDARRVRARRRRGVRGRPPPAGVPGRARLGQRTTRRRPSRSRAGPPGS